MSAKSLLNKECIIRDLKNGNEYVGAYFIDDGKRVRILTGPHSGEARGIGNYQLIELLGHYSGPLAELIATIWSD